MSDSLESPLPISVFIQTKNEEVAIERCIDEVLPHFVEVKVIDSMSEDRTVEIAQAHGADVVDFAWNGRYPKKKQWQIDNVPSKSEWILFLDADERPSPALLAELHEATATGALSGYAAADISLEYWFAGKRLDHGHRVQKRALVHRRKVQFPVVDDLSIPGMGELEGHYQPQVRGAVFKLRERIAHQDPDPVRTWFDRHNRYSDWEAHLRVAQSAKVNSFRSAQGKLFNSLPGKPALFFLYSYVLRAGFLDGRAGFDYAFALASYYWQIGLKVRELADQRLG